MYSELIERLKAHAGEFFCEGIGAEDKKKIVGFYHIVESPQTDQEGPDIAGLKEFYSVVGSLTMYFCKESDEAAFYIGSPDEWSGMDEDFSGWVEMLDEDEEEEALPNWFGSHQVIGEIPASGNYLLIVTSGDECGSVYEFEHDGFEFIKVGSSLIDFVNEVLDPDQSSLAQMASHLRFISGDSDQQWWATELRDDQGKVVVNED